VLPNRKQRRAAASDFDRALAFHRAGRLTEAARIYEQVLTLRPHHFHTLHLLALVHSQLGNHTEAVRQLDFCLLLQPRDPCAYVNRGNSLQYLNQLDEALESYNKAVAVDPNYIDTYNARGIVLQKLARSEEALADYDRVLAHNPDHVHSFTGAAECVAVLCDWERRAYFAGKLDRITPPFSLLNFTDDPALHLRCARNRIGPGARSWTGPPWRHDRIRIAYLSPDFRHHAVAYLIAELIERHDRSRFEIVGVSFGADDASAIRKRLVAAFDQFHEVWRLGDDEVARLLYDLQIDILIRT
jgi:predicted O-linked N-acetylglucosamine transferase (SPINDLY family)